MEKNSKNFFRPSLLNDLRDYDRTRFFQDIGAGLTVGVVAMPLAMAFAIASGLKPEAGLFTAIIAGFLISALGGSKVQIGGPAGAFIVVVYGILHRYGLANLVIATAMSGVILFAMGFFRLGTLVRFIPITVVIGFTNGIAVLIALSQIKDFFGLTVATMPANFFAMLGALYGAMHTIHVQATVLAVACLVVIVVWQFALPALARKYSWAAYLALAPGSVVALVAATVFVAGTGFEVETIGSRFGGIPSALPSLQWPEFSWDTVRFLFIPAMTLALLGAIESLLCARVADGMIGDRHDSNQELMAQGIANFVTPFFGGMPATGTIARTVTNIKSGANSPVAGMVHALVLLSIVWVAAPLAQNIPLAAMAAILLFVAWNMGEWREFAHLRHFRPPYRIILLSVFFLTVIVDLTVAVEVGLVAACITFIYRISSLSHFEEVTAIDYPGLAGHEGTVAAYRLYGTLFFGAVQLIEDLQARLPRRCMVLDFKNVIYIDSSGADALLDFVRTCNKRGVRLVICGLASQPRDILMRCGLMQMLAEDNSAPTVASALDAAVAAL